MSTEPIPSMTTDATGSAATSDAMGNDLLSRVREGMRVLDAAGDEVGTVATVKMGDPGAATIGADAPADPGFFAGIFGADTEPDIPEPLRSRLLRHGFIKIDGKGWLDTDRYVPADLIAGLASDTVRLSATKERLLSDQA